MPSIYQLKPAFQSLLRPLVHSLAERGITANQVTIAALVLSVLAGVLVASSQCLLIVPIVLFLRMALNAIDGMLAREHDMKSELGAILNEIGDVLSDSALYLAFAFHSSFSAPLVVVLVLLACMSEMMGVVAIQIGAQRRYDGPMGKSDRAFVLGTLALAVWIFEPSKGWVNGIVAVVNLLLLYTIYNRARAALREIGQC